MNEGHRMAIKCLRCGRVLDDNEPRCRICNVSAESERPQKSPSSDSTAEKATSNQKSGVTISGFLAIAFFCIFVGAMGYGFLKELAGSGLISAVKNRPAILLVVGGYVLIHLLASRQQLERIGLGFIHKILRTTFILILIAAILALATAILGIGNGTSHGLPDNIRF